MIEEQEPHQLLMTKGEAKENDSANQNHDHLQKENLTLNRNLNGNSTAALALSVSPPTKRHTESEQKMLCEEWKASGLTQKAFWAEKGMDENRFGYWSRKLGYGKRRKAVKLLPAKIASPKREGKREDEKAEKEKIEIMLNRRVMIRLMGYSLHQLCPLMKEMSQWNV